MEEVTRQRAYKNFLLSYQEALTPIWNLVWFAAIDTILDTIADQELKQLAIMTRKLQPMKQQPRVVQQKAKIADLESITAGMKTNLPEQSPPSKEACAQIGEVFARLHDAHKEYAAGANGLAQLATALTPNQYTMVLNAAALPKIQLVVPGTSICPLTAQPPPQPEQTTARGREKIINFTKSKLLPNPNSTALASVDKNSATRVLATEAYTKLEHKYFDNTLSQADIAAAFGCNISQLTKAVTGILYKSGPHHYVPKGKAAKKRPCDTTDTETSESISKRPKTKEKSTQNQPTTSRSAAVTQTVEQEDTLSSSSSSSLSDKALPPGLFG